MDLESPDDCLVRRPNDVMNTFMRTFTKYMLLFMKMSSNASPMKKLIDIEGYEGRRNDVIYYPSITSCFTNIVVYFGGDIQEYTEKMLAHRDYKAHVRWSLEETAELLHHRFPESDIFVVKPSRMHLNTFSCFDNFVEGNSFGVPNHKINIDSLKHLKLLLNNAKLSALSMKMTNNSEHFQDCRDEQCSTSFIAIIGFSKGCVVLNQLLYSFAALKKCPVQDLVDFVTLIKEMYWLEGGHPGGCHTWVTDAGLLQNFSQMNISIKIHVTPYQVQCESRPRIGKEEKIFRETLRKSGADVERVLHFEEEPRSFENHLRVLESFKHPQCN